MDLLNPDGLRRDLMNGGRVFTMILLIGLAACERPQAGEPAAQPAPAEANGTTATVDAASPAMATGAAQCLNREEGFAVQYPADWHVNTGDVMEPCSLFDPEPITVPRDSEVPIEIAIMIDFEGVPFATVTGDVLGRREIARESITVDGREGVRIESATTGEGLHPPGIGSYQYFVDLGDTTMIATTYDAGGVTFGRKRQVLDEMMASFDFREPGA
ncbi:MAG: hypothetical protein WD737_13505 [Gemmatimonadota bacterium]